MNRPARIVLIEDNAGDIELTRRALDLSAVYCELESFQMAEFAIDALRRNPADLILLDLNLAGAHGLEILRVLVSDAQTSRTPVVAVTTSAAPADRDAALALGARDFLTKPASVREFADRLARTVCAFCRTPGPAQAV